MMLYLVIPEPLNNRWQISAVPDNETNGSIVTHSPFSHICLLHSSPLPAHTSPFTDPSTT